MGLIVDVVCLLLSSSLLMHFRCVALAAVSCHTDNPVSSSCYQSDSCLTDHPPLQERQKCLERYQSSEVSMYPSHIDIEDCPVNRHCDAVTNHSQSEWIYFSLGSVDLEVIAVDALHFEVNVSWEYPDLEDALSISRPEGRLRGYEVQLMYENNSRVECFCIWAPRVRSTIVGLNHTLHYQPSSTLQARAKVYTLPFSTRYGAESYAEESQWVRWPRDCHAEGILFNPRFCPPPVVQQPQHILALPMIIPDSTTAEIQVSWLAPSTSEPSLLSYYVYFMYENSSFTFFANGTQNITISGLDVVQDYYIQVQAHSSCSGLSPSTTGPGEISCGILSELIRVSHVESTSSTTFEATSETPSSVMATFPTDTTSHLLLNVIIALVTVVMALLLFALLVSIVIYLYCRYKVPHGSGGLHVNLENYLVPPDAWKPPQKDSGPLDVLVLYTLQTPKEEQILIEKYLVSRLIHRGFEVHSCNNHTKNTIVNWVEEEARLARTILIVCNKSFYTEWSLPSQQRSPLINALSTIIQSSVSEGDIKKYATLLLGEKSEKFIPHNSYLKSMETFVLKMDSSDKDMEKITEFMKYCRH